MHLVVFYNSRGDKHGGDERSRNDLGPHELAGNNNGVNGGHDDDEDDDDDDVNVDSSVKSPLDRPIAPPVDKQPNPKLSLAKGKL